MASQQFCTFLLDGHTFGVPVPKVQEVILFQPMTQVPLASSVVRGMINLRGQIVTAIDLRRRLHMKDRAADQLPMNVVVRTEEGAVSLLVDEIGDVIEVGDDVLESPPETVQGEARLMVLGVYKLADRLLLALDITRAVEVGECDAERGNASPEKNFTN